MMLRGFSKLELSMQLFIWKGRRWPPAVHYYAYIGGEIETVKARIARRYPHGDPDLLRLPWGVWVAYARRNAANVREYAACGSPLAQQLVAHCQAEDMKLIMQGVIHGSGHQNVPPP